MFSLSTTNIKHLDLQLFLAQAEIYLLWQQKQKSILKKQSDKTELLIFCCFSWRHFLQFLFSQCRTVGMEDLSKSKFLNRNTV